MSSASYSVGEDVVGGAVIVHEECEVADKARVRPEGRRERLQDMHGVDVVQKTGENIEDELAHACAKENNRMCPKS